MVLRAGFWELFMLSSNIFNRLLMVLCCLSMVVCILFIKLNSDSITDVWFFHKLNRCFSFSLVVSMSSTYLSAKRESNTPKSSLARYPTPLTRPRRRRRCLALTIEMQSHCDMIISQLRHDYQELEYYNELLLSQHFNVSARQRRRRRGLVNGVGYLANELFGVLDSRFADKYVDDIETTRLNEKHLLSLWKNQTSVIESEFNLMKRMQTTIDKQHKTINKRLNMLEESMNNSQKQIQDLYAIDDFTLSAMAGNSLIQSLKRLQETLLDTITDIYHGQISIHLLSPAQLRKELHTINSQMINDIKLPIQDIDTQIRYIYKLLKVKARVTQKFVIFEVTLPLIGREGFQLYKLIPIPHQLKNNMITIVPVSEYIAINLKHDSYFTITINELDSCLYHEDAYMCKPTKPILHLDNDQNYCDQNTPNNTCRTHRTPCVNKWVELNVTSQYLYFCCDIYTIKVICNDQVTMQQLSQAGVIRLSPQCFIKGKDFVLFSLQKQYHQMKISPEIYTPSIDQINHIVNVKIPTEEVVDDASLNSSFNILGDQIKTIKSSETSLFDDMSHHDIHQYAISYVLLAAALFGCVAWVWRSVRRRAAGARGPAGRPEPLPPPPPPAPPVISARKQSTADPSQLSASAFSERNRASVRFLNLAKRWPSVRRDANTSNVQTSVQTIDNPIFTIEDNIS
ncbi:hypothetical protein JYU34_021278 [Plutella xylostella]|uniref:Envelope fusion protein n=1 Tax=Plutella xylostella TaxID=51655 RepID=A0ABQ7PT99_PLUXY|nr:hypothetical protein JYU34_021278 [Plutella xylostella]